MYPATSLQTGCGADWIWQTRPGHGIQARSGGLWSSMYEERKGDSSGVPLEKDVGEWAGWVQRLDGVQNGPVNGKR